MVGKPKGNISYPLLYQLFISIYQTCSFHGCLLSVYKNISIAFIQVVRSMVMVLNATFNNSSVLSWSLILLVEETGGPGINHRLAASDWQTLSHNVVSSTGSH
jgi:hypothetical protein